MMRIADRNISGHPTEMHYCVENVFGDARAHASRSSAVSVIALARGPEVTRDQNDLARLLVTV